MGNAIRWWDDRVDRGERLSVVFGLARWDPERGATPNDLSQVHVHDMYLNYKP